MKMRAGIVVCLLFAFTILNAQEKLSTTPPVLKGYMGKAGKVTKSHYFNFIKVKDESGEKTRQSTGNYWEVSYVYDSVFRQKASFSEFMIKQIKDAGGILFWNDTTQIHFAIPSDTTGNLWGSVSLTSDKVYRLKLIREQVFQNKLKFDTIQILKYKEFVTPVKLPARINVFPNSVIERARYSKFNHSYISFIKDKRSNRQTLMGPYWDIKVLVVNEEGKTDKQISTVEIMESYYRAAIKAGGKIIKSRPRELVFNIPVGDDSKLWVRVLTSLEGVYYLKMTLQADKDAKPAEPISQKSQTKKN